jgi:hypothetical protein
MAQIANADAATDDDSTGSPTDSSAAPAAKEDQLSLNL